MMQKVTRNGKTYSINEDGMVQTTVDVPVYEMVETDFIGFLDLLSVLAVGDDLLMDIQFTALEVVQDDMIRFLVSGFLDSEG